MPASTKGASKALPKKEEKLKEPNDYRVVLLNDNYTTCEFVVEVLKFVFHLNDDEAIRIMTNVHKKGRGVVGRFTWDIAQTKAEQVHVLARDNDFPLSCVVEEA